MSSGVVAGAARPWTDDADQAIAALAKRYKNASGTLMKTVSFLGGKAENALELLPDGVKDLIEDGTSKALHLAYSASRTVSEKWIFPEMGTWANTVAVTLSGAAGGFAGLSSAIVELPVTVATMLGTIQKVATSYGFDPNDEAIRVECIRVFGSGGPLVEDDGIDASFLSSRVLVNGATVNAVIGQVAPRFAMVMGQKLAAQTIPVLGALAGAGVNFTFISYYEQMAHVRFGLMKLAKDRGPERVGQQFRLAVQAKTLG